MKTLSFLSFLFLFVPVSAADFSAISIQGRLDPPERMDGVSVTILGDGSIVGTANEVDLVPDSNGIFVARLEGFSSAILQGNVTNYEVSLKKDGTEIAKLPIGSVPFALAIKGINADGNIVGVIGNVGIGTTNPAQKLTVAGTIESTSGGIKFPDGSVQVSAAPASLWAISGEKIYTINSRNVGIGTSNPLGPLQVNRVTYKYSWSTQGGGHSYPRCPCDTRSSALDCGSEFTSSSDLGATCYDWTLNGSYWAQSGYQRGEPVSSTALIVDNSLNVGIGTSTATQKLTVAGTIESTSGGIKFPDGTMQTTAATEHTLLKLQSTSLSSVPSVTINLPCCCKRFKLVANLYRTGGGAQYLIFDNDAGTKYKWAISGPSSESSNSATYIKLSPDSIADEFAYVSVEIGGAYGLNKTLVTGTATFLNSARGIAGGTISGYFNSNEGGAGQACPTSVTYGTLRESISGDIRLYQFN